MSRIKQTAGEVLAALIQERIPALAGKVFPMWADEEELASYPSVAILPQKLDLVTFNDDEVDDSDPNILVVSVGDFVGGMEVRVYAKSPEERSAIGDQILALFFETEMRTGIIRGLTPPMQLPVPGSGGTHTMLQPTVVSFVLEDEAWREEMVFSKKRFDFITLEFEMPVLVARKAATISKIELMTSIEADLSQPAPPPPYEEIDITA